MQLRQLLLQYEIENNIKHDEAAKRIGLVVLHIFVG